MTAPSCPPLRRRTLLQGSALAGLAALLPSGFARAQEARPLRAAMTGYSVMNTLDPARAGTISEAQVIWGLFNALLAFDARMNIVPDLAESWKALPDGSLEFILRQGVTFHDGSALTSEDVAFSLQRVKDKATGSPYAAKLAVVERIETPDARTVRLVTGGPSAPLLTALTNTRSGTQILPKKTFETMGAEAFARRPVGTGPYKLTDWKANQSLELAAHDGYFRAGRPIVKSLRVPLIKEMSSGVTALLGNEVDLVSETAFADVQRLESGRQAKIQKVPGLSSRFLELNVSQKPFDDVHFRRALSMAFDRDVVVQVALFGQAKASQGIIPPSLSWAHDGAPRAAASFNPERARAELAKSRYGKGTAAKVLTWGSDTWRRFAEVFVAQANEVLGTALTVEVSEANTVTDRVRKSQIEAATWGWKGLVDPDEYLDIFHSKGWRNRHGFADATIDRLVEAARVELDQAKRGQACIAADKAITELCPVIFAYHEDVVAATRPNVSGYVATPYGGFGAQLADVTLG